MTVANSPVQLFIFGIFEHKWGTRKHIGDLKKYSWCIPVQKEIKPIIWGAVITPEPWNRQQCWFIFEDPNVRVARLSKPRDNDTQIKHSQTHEKHTMRWTSTQKGNCVLEHNIWSTRKTHSGASWTPICWDHVTTQFHRCYIPGQRGAKWYITWANIMVVFNPRKLSMTTNHTSTNHPQRHTEHYQELVNPRRFWVYEFRALWMWRNEPYGNRKESIRVRDLPWLYITIKLPRDLVGHFECVIWNCTWTLTARVGYTKWSFYRKTGHISWDPIRYWHKGSQIQARCLRQAFIWRFAKRNFVMWWYRSVGAEL